MTNFEGASRPTRRNVLHGLGAGAAVLAAPSIVRAKSAGTIKVGFISPLTGPLAPFGATDGHTLKKIRALLKDGLKTKKGTYDVEILVRDSQSDPNHSSEMASDLILNEGVQMLLPASTTDTINPAADQAELNGVPCLSTGAPWQAVIYPRGGKGHPFQWTYHFFWGLNQALDTFVGIWNRLETNKKIGMIFPQNADGKTWGNNYYGLPAPTRKAGYKVDVPGFFQPGTNDFSAQISDFKGFHAEIVGGISYVSDLATFVNQAAQQGYHPRAVTVAAALLFPTAVEAMGKLGYGMTCEVWWTPAFPFKSSLTGQDSRQIADDWEKETGKQWTQPLGYSHAIWEIALHALKEAKDPTNNAAIRDALKVTKMQTLIGPVNFNDGPTPNVSTTPIFGGQWIKGKKWPYELSIVDNSVNPLFKVERKVTPLAWAS